MIVLLSVIFFVLYQSIFGIICYFYFKSIKKEIKGNKLLFFFFYGPVLRIWLCLALAIITANLILYGYVGT
jgi:hypothetical protein